MAYSVRTGSRTHLRDGALYGDARDSAVRRVLLTRFAGLVLLLAYVLLAPGAGTELRLIAAAIVLGPSPFVVLIERYARVSQRDALHMALTCGTLFAVASVISVHWIAAVVAYVALSMTLIGNGTQALGIPVITFFGVAFAALGYAHGVPGAIPALLFVGVIFALSQQFYTEWRRTRAEVDARYETLVSAARLFFWEIEIATELITAVHGDVEGALGWSREEVLGTSFRNYLATPDIVAFGAILDGEVEFDRILDMYHRDGRVIPFRNQIRDTGDGRLRAAASDFSELSEATERLRFQSEHDELTGLLNRRGLLMQIEERIGESNDGVCLLVIDLVRFKDINDAFGHERGDEVIRVIGNRLATESGSDVVARLGGNEFAVLLPGSCGERDRMTEMVERIGDVVRHPVAIGGAGIAIRASLGIAPWSDDMTPIELLRQADVAANEAKLNRLSWTCYQPAPIEPIVERLTLAAQLDSALENNEFQLWVQPKVSLVDHRLVGVEALARWHHPELGILTPYRFIGLIEISEAYHRFSDAMVRQALDIAIECEPYWPDVEISVNLHPRSFDEPQLVDRIGHMLELTGVYPSRLKLEITEVEAMTESGTALETCRSLAELGIGISVDDFGTGHASLNRLRMIAPAEVKLDQAFIRNIEHNIADQTIVRSTVQLAESLGMVCVAEGVETDKVRQIVESLGCEIVQGYHFGRPMPVEAFLAQLQGHEPPCWKPTVSADARRRA